MTIEEFVNKDYDQAIAELAKIKRGPLVKQLQRGPSTYNTEKLIYELTKLEFNPDGVVLNEAVIPKGSVLISEEELQSFKEQVNQSMDQVILTSSTGEKMPGGDVFAEDKEVFDDEVLKSFHHKRAAAWKEASFLQHELGNVDLNIEDAYNKCQRVLYLTNVLITELDAHEKYYKENGQLPEQKQAEENPSEYPKLNGIELYKRVETLKKNISRDKKSNPDKLPKWEAELAVRNQQLKVETNGTTE